MRSPTSKDSDRRKAERRGQVTRTGNERRVMEQRGIAEAMVDALEDILKWERASERSLRVADASKPDLSN